MKAVEVGVEIALAGRGMLMDRRIEQGLAEELVSEAESGGEKRGC